MIQALERHSITLHQQDGGMSVQAFADKEGISLEQARRFIKRGLVFGARRDARSKKWTVYPPAKLLAEPRKRKADGWAERDTPRAAPPSGAGVMAAGHADTHPAQAVIGAAEPLPAKPVLTLGSGRPDPEGLL